MPKEVTALGAYALRSDGKEYGDVVYLTTKFADEDLDTQRMLLASASRVLSDTLSKHDIPLSEIEWVCRTFEMPDFPDRED